MLRQLAATLAIAALVAPLGCGSSRPTPPVATNSQNTVVAETAPPPVNDLKPRGTPKALGDSVKRGLAWLVTRQMQDGGWGQGDDAPQQRGGEPKGTANVADSSMALLAFIRAGNTPRGGEHRMTVERGLDYVMSQIEASDKDSLSVTSVRGTRVQAKIGQYADTFAALMVLTEVRGHGRDAIANARIDAALKKVVRKVEKNQRENGTWDDNGWAPVLSQALAAKGLNRAAQGGATVSGTVLQRVEAQAASPAAEQGNAGVGLYGKAAKSAGVRDSAATKKAKAEDMKKKGNKPSPGMKSPDAPTKAEIAAAEADADAANRAALDNERQLIVQLNNPQFVAGFGNNGGEEFLSYLLISETLVQRGGDEWARWDAAISKLVDQVQNEDGSWTGHHCITGRTFCTAAALLVLLGDRTPAARNVIAS